MVASLTKSSVKLIVTVVELKLSYSAYSWAEVEESELAVKTFLFSSLTTKADTSNEAPEAALATIIKSDKSSSLMLNWK